MNIKIGQWHIASELNDKDTFRPLVSPENDEVALMDQDDAIVALFKLKDGEELSLFDLGYNM
ncbi:MAG: hypothetical protein ACRC5C_06800, partial [Bacilli bacterium]